MGKYEGRYCEELANRLGVEDLNDCFYFPKYFAVETCNNCNGSCIMCAKSRKELKELQIMKDMVFDKIVEEIKSYNHWIEMVCLNSDGEPLLDKKISERVKKLKDIGIKHVYISTNGQLLTKDVIEELMTAGLDDIRISMDGYFKQTFEKIRRGLDYDKIKENVLNLIQMRNQKQSHMHIRIRMVELDENAGERKEWLEYWKSKVNENDKVQLMPMHTWSGKIADEEQSRIEYYSDKPCVSVFSSFAINYNGDVQLCDSDIDQQEILGNIMENSIQKIWQGERLEAIRNWHANSQRNNIKICQGCDHWGRQFKENY